MKPMVLLAVQALFAAFGLRQLFRNVFPETRRLTHPSLIVDVWGPLIVIGPMLFLTGQIGEHVAGPGWLAIGGPLIVAIIGAGMSLVRQSVIHEPAARGDSVLIRACIAGACASALLLLLGAAHDQTLWMGQCAFAVGAVLLWINTPTEALKSRASEGPGDARAGLGLTAAAACGVVQGIVMLNTIGNARLAGAAIAVVYTVIALGAAVRVIGPAEGARMSLWCAAFGVFFSLGLISLSRMMPEALRALRTGESEPVRRVACGFGALALEATALMLACAILAVATRLGGRGATAIGLLMAMAATTLLVWRITHMMA
jgi:hypothetical protein